MSGERVYKSSSVNPPTIGFESLPIVGERRAGRSRMWRWTWSVLLAVWALAGLLVWIVGA